MKSAKMFFRLLSFFILLLCLQSCAYYFGNLRVQKSTAQQKFPLPLRTVEDGFDPIDRASWKNQPIIKKWAKRDLGEDWKKHGKVSSPRIILAKLALKQDLEEVNQFLQAAKPWGKPGTDWLMNPNGDYDFTESVLINILYLFGKDSSLLYPKTIDHLLEKLLVEQGKKPKTKAPNSLLLLKETENHILMRESTRYLRKAWLRDHKGKKKLDEEIKKSEKWLLHHLEELNAYGYWEFNSIPYLGYTVVPLLVIEAHSPNPAIRNEARKALDLMNWEYALGSLDFRRVVPFRRQLRRADRTHMSKDPHTSLMKAWYYQQKGIAVTDSLSPHNQHQALLALIMPYQLPQEIIEFMDKPAENYFVKISHGWNATPELHWKGPSALLTGGGVQRTKVSQLVARPIVLILQDSLMQDDYKNCFHLPGHPKMAKKRNSGIYKGLAVSNRPVVVPSHYKADLSDRAWQVFSVQGKSQHKIVVYNYKDLGLLYYVPNWKASSKDLLEQIQAKNPTHTDLKQYFTNIDGQKIEYHPQAPKKLWVIKKINGEEVDRKHGFWPRLQIEYTFEHH
jgi:hypothetical protein